MYDKNGFAFFKSRTNDICKLTKKCAVVSANLLMNSCQDSLMFLPNCTGRRNLAFHALCTRLVLYAHKLSFFVVGRSRTTWASPKVIGQLVVFLRDCIFPFLSFSESMARNP